MNATSYFSKSSTYFNKLVKIIAIIFLSLYLIIWAISSPLSKYFLEPILTNQGLTLSPDTSISYNPFMSQLTISDLTLFNYDKGHEEENNKADKVLSIKKLAVRLILYRLLFDEIVVSEFQLHDAFIKIDKTPTQLIIAGVDLNKKSASDNNENPTPNEPTSLNYQLILPKLDFSQINIEIQNDRKPHHIAIETLLVTKVKANEQAQQATLSMQSIIDTTKVALTANADFKQGQGEVTSKIDIANYPISKLQGYVDELSDLSGSFSLTSEQKITLIDEQIKLHINKAEMSNKNLIVGYQQQFFNLEKLQQNITNLDLTLNKGEITGLTGLGQLTLNNASAYYDKSSQKLAYFKELKLNDISFHFTDTPEIKILSLIIDDLYVSKNEDINLPPLVKLKQFSINDIAISEHHLSINKIILDSLQSEIIVNKEKNIANLVTLPETVSEAEKEEIADVATGVDKEISTASANFIISLNEFSLRNDNQFSFLDNSVEPTYKRELFIDTLYLGDLSNSKDKQDQQTPFELIGRSNKYAKFNFKGFTQPFAKKPIYHLKGFLKELSLPAVSTYMKKAMNMELKSGQLNTNIDITLTGEQLNGNVVILLQSLETAIANSDEAGALIDQGALPFNMALGMLKDRHGNVELDVPLSGLTSDPQFGMSSILMLITQKAIWMATQDYLMTTFVPYANIVSAAMKVGDFALKLRFENLIYQSKQIEPNEDQRAYLQAFISLMQDKKDARIKICAISTPADINLITGSEITNKKHIHQLKSIAEQRASAFKEYIIKKGKVDSSRLLLCAPKIDSSENAQPRIELSV